MLNLCGTVAAILKMATARNFSMSGIYSGHHNLPTYEMSLKSDNVEFVQSKFDMLVDNDVPTLKNFYRSPFSKWPPQYRKNSTLSDII
jgi:5-carboxymethyl-2-hydroxymuconate isomerase